MTPASPASLAFAAIIWSNPKGRAISSWFQLLHIHRGMCASKSLIEMDWVIQLTLTHSGVLCAFEAVALGHCHKSLSQHRTTHVLTVFIKFNWVELFLSPKTHRYTSTSCLPATADTQTQVGFFSVLSFHTLVVRNPVLKCKGVLWQGGWCKSAKRHAQGGRVRLYFHLLILNKWFYRCY